MAEDGGPPPLRRLLELIGLVNPTERGLSKAEESRRYRLKSKLQSLLVVHFPDGIVVTADEGNPGVVGLAHRTTTVGSAHAVLEELSEEARSRVRFLLDTRHDEPAPAPVPSTARKEPRPHEPAGDVEGLLAEGQAAQQAYDYEAARLAFVRAFEMDGGSPRASVALLELLVDALADDVGALALVDGLHADARKLPLVRQLLALASARQGQQQAALAWLPAEGGERAADVVAVLARQAMEGGSLQQCEELLEVARARGMVSTELLALQKSAASRRETERAPLELQAQAALDQGDVTLAEQRAQDILSRWPESKAARQVLEKVRARQAADLAQEHRRRALVLVDAAREALKQGRWKEALAQLGEAGKLDAGTPGHRELLQQASQAQVAWQAQQQVDETTGLIASSQWPKAIKKYLALEPAQRRLVRDRHHAPELQWLEDLGEKAQRVAVEDVAHALESLRRARDGASDAAVSMQLLDASWRLLSDVGDARAARRSLEQRLARERLLKLADAFRDARAELDQGRVDAATRVLEEARTLDLDAAVAEQRDGLEAALRRHHHLADHARHVKSGDFLQVAAVARILAAGGDAERWHDEERRAEKGVAEQWRVGVVEGEPALPGPLVDAGWLIVDEGKPLFTLTADGNRAVLVTAHGRFLFVRLVRVEDGAVLRAFHLLAPERLDVLDALVSGDVLTVALGSSAILRVSLATGLPLTWRPVAPLLTPMRAVDGATLMPDGRHVWWVGESQGALVVKVLDLETWTVARELQHAAVHEVVAAAEPVAVVVMGTPPKEDARVVSARGGVHALRAPPAFEVSTATLHPTRDALLFHGESMEGPEVREGSARARLSTPRILDADTSVAFAPPGGRTAFVVVSGRAGNKLVTLDVQDAPREASVTPVAEDCLLLQDARARHSVLALGTEEGTVFWRASDGAAPPAGRQRSWRGQRPPVTGRVGLSEEGFQAQQAIRNRLDHAPDREAAVKRFREEHAEDAEALINLLGVLILPEEREPVLGDLAARFPTHLHAALTLAVHQLDGKRPDIARQVLERAHTGNADAVLLLKWLHLLGSAKFQCGDLEGARRDWKEGASMDGGTRCRACLELVEPMPGDGDLSTASPVVHLRELLRRADDVQGDARAVARVLDHWVVRGAGDIQSAARLADAWLQLEDTDAAARFEKTRVLAWFVDLLDVGLGWEVLPVAQGWPREKVRALEQAAQAWLGLPETQLPDDGAGP